MLKKIALTKRRATAMAALRELRAKRTQLRADEAELQKQIDASDDVSEELLAKVDQLEKDRDETGEAIDKLEKEIEEIDAKLAELDDDTDPNDPEGTGATGSRSGGGPSNRRAITTPTSNPNYRSRSRCFRSRSDCEAFYQRSEVKDWLGHIRTLGGSGKRSVTGAELTIPTIVLDVVRDNLEEGSKLISRVRLRRERGQARQTVIGKVPDGVWTEMCANLNELNFVFTELEVDGYKVGGYIPICNATLKDSDLNLGEEIMGMLLGAIGSALDKAIVYGLGPDSKMPVGIVTRLNQASQPGYWGANQGAWTDLRTSNILKLDIGAKAGIEFFQPLLGAMAKAKPNYSASGRTTWIMNRKTHLDLMARGLAFNSAGTLVAGLGNQMPVENGDIIELEFMPDNELVGGFMDVFLLVEREGGTVSISDQVFFLQDKTVYKAVARYDGQPIFGEAFVAINYNNAEVTKTMSFTPDYANQDMNVLICIAAEGASGKTRVTVSGTVSGSNKLMYKVKATNDGLKVGAKPVGYTQFTSGSTEIVAATGTPIAVVEVDTAGRIVSTGSVLSVAGA